MKKYVKYIYILISLVFIVYLSLPEPTFPEKISDAIVSEEPADVETPLRRGYYTDFERNQAVDHYKEEFEYLLDGKIKTLTLRLNHPPEEAQVLVRDQTRSTFLEEYVHPLRESLLINGFKPTKDSEVIQIDGKFWNQKIIVKYVKSSLFVRLSIGLSVIVLTYFLKNLLSELLLDYKKLKK